MKKGISPLFKWFGSKWLSAPKYPAPIHDHIVEPFAGGAGYSLRYPDRQVTICENNPYLSKLWPWLINVATESMIREIPIDIPIGTDIRTLGLSEGQSLLLKSWQRTCTVGGCWTVSPWGNLSGQWTANKRSRVSEEVYAVKHWNFCTDGMMTMHKSIASRDDDATWFIDPMYQYNYQYMHKVGHDYKELAQIANTLPGQVIVCEAACPKTDKVPNWLPFAYFGLRATSRKKQNQHHHSKELIWTNSHSEVSS